MFDLNNSKSWRPGGRRDVRDLYVAGCGIEAWVEPLSDRLAIQPNRKVAASLGINGLVSKPDKLRILQLRGSSLRDEATDYKKQRNR